MGQEVLIVIMLILLSVPVVFFFAPGLSGGMMRPTYEREVRALINPSAPRRSNIIALKKALSNEELIDRVTKEQVKRSPSSTLTLQKRLKFARWRINPLVFRSLECSISL
ncbi:MAG: hypothetical protein DCC75_11605, partial [Proteobacteria bacterium]